MPRSFLLLSVLLFIGLPLSTGCVPVEFLSDVPDELEAIAAEVSTGKSTRTELHTNLGEPMATSPDGTVEVYRAASGHDVTGIVWLGPAPPLFGGRDVIGYLMVRYDSDGTVRDVENGFTAEMEPEYDSERGGRRYLKLSLPPYDFRARYVGGLYEESLVTSLPDRWPPLTLDQCRLLFVPNKLRPTSASVGELYIDDRLALTYRADKKYVYQFVLSPGPHRAAVVIPVYKKDRFEAEWNCQEGTTAQLFDDIGFGPRPDRERWHSGYGPVGSLNVGSGTDLESSNRQLVIFHSGLTPNLERED